MQTLVFDFPYFLVCFSIVKPYFLPNSIRMRVNSSARANGVIMIESLPVNKGSLFAKLAHELKLLVDTQTFKKILSSIVRGLNLFRIMQGFLQIVARVRPEDNAIAEEYEKIRRRTYKAHYLKRLCKIPFNLFPLRSES